MVSKTFSAEERKKRLLFTRYAFEDASHSSLLDRKLTGRESTLVLERKESAALYYQIY